MPYTIRKLSEQEKLNLKIDEELDALVESCSKQMN